MAAAYHLGLGILCITAAVYYDIPAYCAIMRGLQPIFVRDKFNQTIKIKKAVRQP